MQNYMIKPSKKIIGYFVIVTGIMLLLYPLFTNVYSYMIQEKLKAQMENQQVEYCNVGKVRKNDKISSVETHKTADPQNFIREKLKTLMENQQVKYCNVGKVRKNDKISSVEKHKIADPQNFTQALLEIPSIKLSTVVLPGTSQDTLKISPGWYEQSALPGKGNTAIAGHRTMYGEWFRNLSRLTQGEIIILKYEEVNYKYQVESVFAVKNDDWSAIKPCGYNALTLTTCVKGDSGHRLVVRAKMLPSSEQ